MEYEFHVVKLSKSFEIKKKFIEPLNILYIFLIFSFLNF